MAEQIFASDGLRARDNGCWAKEKLSFLDEFGPPALKATRSKAHRYFVDLFAGPGINVDARESGGTGEEFRGSGIRALTMHAPNEPELHFTHAILVNKDREDHTALNERVKRLHSAHEVLVPIRNVQLLHGDSNRLVHRIMGEIHPKAFGLIVADIESPSQLPWSTVQAIRSRGHQSIDLYVLFPLAMGLNRMISFSGAATEVNAPALTSFYGSEAWRDIAEQRKTGAQSSQMRTRLLECYMDQLRGLGWSYVKVARDVRRRGNAGLYKMIHATSHPAGDRISGWSAGKPDRDSGQLPLL